MAIELDGVCKQCSKSFKYKMYPSSKSNRGQLCSRYCSNLYKSRITAEKRGNVRRYTGEGKSYVKLNGRHMHRVVMEEKLGRPLEEGEIVHHIDGNFRNNDPSNLKVMTQSEHAALHFTKNRKCSVGGCTSKHKSLGYCNRHYQQFKIHGKTIS